MAPNGLPSWYEELLVGRTKQLLDSGKAQLFDGAGGQYFCRPDEVLVAAAYAHQLQPALKKMQAEPMDTDPDLRVARYRINTTDVPSAVAQLRKQADAVGAAAPHHVLFGAPLYHGSPGGPPVPVPKRWSHSAESLNQSSGGRGIAIGIVDTGIAERARALPWMRDHVTIDGTADIDILDGDGDQLLDLEAGHGTFIAGVVQQVAGESDVIMRAALDPDGVTDELTVARVVLDLIERHDVRIVNLSLGGYADSDEVGLLAMDVVLGRDDCVFVAAAGNYGSDRPFYPAADKRVLGVAALGTNGLRAAWSNYGDWVQACVPGQHLLSAYVVGRDGLDSDHDGVDDEFLPPAPCALWSGTSFAAPQVAALIAAECARSGASARDAAQAVLATGTPFGRLGVKLASPIRGRRMPAGVP